MRKILKAALLLVVATSLMSGCAVIDFLDGKYADPTSRNNQYDGNSRGSSNYGSPSGGGHSHH